MKKETTSDLVCKYMVLKDRNLMWLGWLMHCTITECKEKISNNDWSIQDITRLIGRGVL